MAAFDYAPLIPLLPLASFVTVLLLGHVAPSLLPRRGALPGIIALGGSLVLSLWMLVPVRAGNYLHDATFYQWVAGDGTFNLHFGILVDPLSALMLVIVSLVAFLVFVFSLGYMNDEGETGLPRYYAGLSLFAFSMLAFVIADNLLMAFMFFELVGLCSWLLIGFWFREAGPPSAAKKAFLVTRFGDYFFLIGVVAVFATFGTATFVGDGSFVSAAEQALSSTGNASAITTYLGLDAQAWITVLGLLILGGVIGKSAQFPLHTWLPDAMEGPTPVSALIHAATMVAAGVYLVARMYGFYALSPTALAIIALIGGFTALLAATMGVVKREIKQVLAYSTISQYGYMMLALGGGGYVAAVFHLTTHAFFKALLFLGAGAVIIAMHHNENMWNMGGLKEKMPVTYYTFLAGSLALAGIFPFAGFWSKDEVLYEALVHGLGGSPVLLVAWALGLLAVPVTAFYTFRMVLLTFHGEPRTETARHPHSVRWNVKLPLVVLGTLAVVAGFINMVPVEDVIGTHLAFLHDWLDHGFDGVHAEHYGIVLEDFAQYSTDGVNLPSIAAAGLSLALALAGAAFAWRLFSGPDPKEHTARLGGIRRLLVHNYYQDEYQVWLATGLTLPMAKAADVFDQGVVDGLVDLTSSVSLFAGRRLRRIQSGVVSNYAGLIVLGLVALLLGFALYGGWF